jgi:hypothetical protein
VTSTGFEANGDLQTASEERDEDEPEGEATVSRGTDDARTRTTQGPVRARKLALWAQRSRHPYTVLATSA